MTNAIILILPFAGIMLWLTWQDWWSFRRNQHIDYKSMIVSVGVLGTFVGIFLGLWEFDTKKIASSVPQLLEGLKLAFFTSIMGMGLSVLLSIWQAKPKEKSKEAPILQRLDVANQNLAAILEIVKQLRTDIYQHRSRFTKLGTQGQALPDEATQWVAIEDNETGFLWEMKTNDGSLQDGKHTYTWYQPEADVVGKENGGNCQGCRCDTQAYVEAINEKQLAGFSDWRVPTIEELKTLVNEQSPIDKRYFPNLDVQECAWYCSSTAHPSEKETLCCYSLDSGLQGGSRYGYGHLLLIRKNACYQNFREKA